MQAVWIISTPLGDAVRSRYDADEVEGHIRLKASSCTQFIPQEPPMRLVTVGQYAPSDMPDYGKRDTEISNVCGFVAGFSSLYDRHPAWRNVRSTLGYFREAYSLRGGNLLFLRGKLIFKGATSRKGVYDTVVRLVSEPTEPVLKAYLIIATAYMRRNLFVHGGCLLEEMLSQFAWCRVMHRCGMPCARALSTPLTRRAGTRRCPTRSSFTSTTGRPSASRASARPPTWAPSPSRAGASSTSGSGGTTACRGRATRSGWPWSTV